MRLQVLIFLLVAFAAIAIADDEQDYKDFIKKYRGNKGNSNK
jgi:hypothetical protein